MKAALLDRPNVPLRVEDVPRPEPGRGQVRLRVLACGVCRTDLHIADGELSPHRHPIIPGHQIVGIVDAAGAGVAELRVGDRAGASWLAWTCGHCAQCTSGRENLCANAEFTGYDRNGGFAEFAVVDAKFAVALPDRDAL
ncbi:MAG TPA: alcohol dehydrogenase catalytic domain-containing protein, partial [Thermoanaerobaculia bacterium]